MTRDYAHAHLLTIKPTWLTEAYAEIQADLEAADNGR